ncbi:MAG: hypothetical protein LC804_12660 [Acidobacteria bacterium]|nr:hypothetical protein [Acidobacteriota bacterium]
MTFANPLPWWALIVVLAAAAFQAYRVYAHTPVPLSPGRRRALTALRFLTLLILVVFLLRPVIVEPAAGRHDAVVAVLVDASRSMGLADGGRTRRIDRARALVRDALAPSLGNRLHSRHPER